MFARQLFYSLCPTYVCSNLELFQEKHQKTQHCNLFLLLLINSYFYSKMIGRYVQEPVLCTEEEILVAFLPIV